jgi:hypothetical protein
MTSARDLIDVVLGDAQDISLPSLTREELVAMGDEPMLAEAEDELWWQAQSDEVREALVGASHRGLVARGLLKPDLETGGLVAVDTVRVVLETRRHPSWLCVVREPVAQDETRVVIAGIERDDAPPAAMITARIEGIHLSRLMGADEAVGEAVRWLTDTEFHTDTPNGMDPAGRPLLRAVEVLLPRRPGVREEMGDRRALLVAVDSSWRLAEVDAQGTTQPEQQVGPDEVGAWLRAAIFGDGAPRS